MLEPTPEQILAAAIAEAQVDTGASELIERWATPSNFFEDMGWETAPYQQAISDALPTHKRVSARGPHGLGKTAVTSRLMIWFAVWNEIQQRDWKIIGTSGSHFQLRAYLWPEVHKWVKKLDWSQIPLTKWVEGEQLLKQALHLEHGAAETTSPDKPELIEGAHATAILIVFDESKAIADPIWNALEGALSTADASDDHVAYALAVSTPGPTAGRFYDIHQRKPGLTTWRTFHVSIEDAISAGRISNTFPDQMRELWGEESTLYANRVLGEFRPDDEDAVIPLAWIEAAITRWHEIQADPLWNRPADLHYGIDVARLGPDRTVLAPIYGSFFIGELIEHPNAETVGTVSRIAEEMRFPGCTGMVDATFNPGVYDLLRSQGFNVEPFIGAAGVPDWLDETGLCGAWNTRTAAWWHMRQQLDPKNKPTLCLPPDDVMIGDLAGPKKKHRSVPDPQNRIQLESKEETKKRLGRSPDRGDAVVMARWSPPPPPAPAEEWVPDAGFGGGLDWSR